MLTFFHAPNSRSTSILALIKEMGIEDKIDIREVTIRRQDGSGGPDPANPHPDGKVPCLQDGDDLVYERAAVMLYLTDRFPEAGMGPLPGEPKRGTYLSWLFHYQGVIEPLMMLKWAGIDNEVLRYQMRSFEDAVAHIDAALADGPWLLGERMSAADLLISGLFLFAKIEPEQPRVRDWIKRCTDRPAEKAAWAEDNAKAMNA
ncbi:glutathione S-transferase family protein [Paracoccus suum]|uniref:Glutathione S-transferase family protein n=1 Tax=Paracoccus suum TaxID=2259340 RepID=A0A344PIJ4_9RHOB|nr:glutathione S-transferase family protein [Paracoccus suum]AXC49199.1 glutathione S-transferase family protein [Paracoccus suum]